MTANRRLAEVSCLASRVVDWRTFLLSFCQMTRVMAQFARHQDWDNLLISVHPRHARFFRRYFGFYPLCERVTICPYVRGRPAVGLNLDFKRIDRERPACWQSYFGVPLPSDELLPAKIPTAEKQALRSIAAVSFGNSNDSGIFAA